MSFSMALLNIGSEYFPPFPPIDWVVITDKATYIYAMLIQTFVYVVALLIIDYWRHFSKTSTKD